MTARSLFLDTSGWLALLNASESRHAEALQVWLQLMRQRRSVVLTDWIIAETGNGLSRSLSRSRFVDLVNQFFEAPSVEIVSVSRPLVHRALSDYGNYTDKAWGLVDCASFIVMRDRAITEAFTTDRDFEQAGFTRLLST